MRVAPPAITDTAAGEGRGTGAFTSGGHPGDGRGTVPIGREQARPLGSIGFARRRPVRYRVPGLRS